MKVNSARGFIPILDLSVTAKTGDVSGTAVAGDRTLKTGTVPGNWARPNAAFSTNAALLVGYKS